MTTTAATRLRPLNVALTGRVRGARSGWGPELLVISLVGLVMPLVVAVHYGSISAPVSDDWSYDLAAYHLAYHGNFDLYHWGTINLIGQLVLAVPVIWIFGPHPWVLNIWTCGIGAVGLLAVNYLGRSLGLSRRQALFAAVLMGAGPMWAVLATSFMTDIQSVSFMAMALAVAASDTRTDRIITRRSVAALALAGFAFTIREPTGVAFAAIAICRLGRCGRPDRRSGVHWAAIVGVAGAALLVFYRWRQSLPSGGVEGPADWNLVGLGAWTYQQWLFPLFGLMLAPVAVVIGPVRVVRRALTTCRTKLLVAWTVMPVLPVLRYVVRDMHLTGWGSAGPVALLQSLTAPVGNSFFSYSGVSLNGSPYLPEGVAWALGPIAIGSTLVVVAGCALGLHRWLGGSRRRNSTPSQAHYVAVMLTVVAAGSFVVLALLIGSERYMWDRYLLPGVMASALLLLYVGNNVGEHAHVPIRGEFYGAVALTGLAVLSLVNTIADEGYVGSQWHYSNRVAASMSRIPKQLIYTDWTWSSTQDSAPQFELPNYRPCYAENLNRPDLPGDIDFVRGGSWVQSYTYSMFIDEQSSTIPVCHSPIKLLHAP